MKTIEERADEFIGHPFECDEGTPITMARLAYVRGAKEQKEIDDKRIAELESFAERATKMIEAEKAFREHLEDENEKLIEKAWEIAQSLYEAGRNGLLSLTKEEFRKAMEE